MNKFKLDSMVKGWFVGGFTPSVYDTQDVEVAVKRYKTGDRDDRHHHRKATEITVIIEGVVRMNNEVFHKNDIIIIEPYESADFYVLEQTTTVVVKLPGALNDKYAGGNDD
jgi:anti-sigma factor ChrR (cupin superfamily)